MDRSADKAVAEQIERARAVMARIEAALAAQRSAGNDWSDVGSLTELVRQLDVTANFFAPEVTS